MNDDINDKRECNINQKLITEINDKLKLFSKLRIVL
jgi:hypothetical protein